MLDREGARLYYGSMKNQDARYYAPKEIERFLDVTSKDLFYWNRTWGLITPDIKGKGRGSKNLYRFENLIELALIKELLHWGISLATIQRVFLARFSLLVPDGGGVIRLERNLNSSDLWAKVGARREYWERKGLELLFFKFEDDECLTLIGPAGLGKSDHRTGGKGKNIRSFEKNIFLASGHLVIDLLTIIRFLEGATGERFE